MMTVSLGTATAENLAFQFLPLPTNRRQCENFRSTAIRGWGLLHGGTTFRSAACSHGCVLARVQLPDRRPDLPDGESSAARAGPARAHHAAPARALGAFAGPEFCLRASQPAESRERRRRHLYFGPRPRRSVGYVSHLSRGHVLRDLSANFRGRRGDA